MFMLMWYINSSSEWNWPIGSMFVTCFFPISIKFVFVFSSQSINFFRSIFFFLFVFFYFNWKINKWVWRIRLCLFPTNQMKKNKKKTISFVNQSVSHSIEMRVLLDLYVDNKSPKCESVFQFICHMHLIKILSMMNWIKRKKQN